MVRYWCSLHATVSYWFDKSNESGASGHIWHWEWAWELKVMEGHVVYASVANGGAHRLIVLFCGAFLVLFMFVYGLLSGLNMTEWLIAIYLLLLLQKQGENSQEVMLGTGCFKSGPLSARITIPRRGFAVGQSIPFSVDVENQSRKKLNVRMALIQVPQQPRLVLSDAVKLKVMYSFRFESASSCALDYVAFVIFEGVTCAREMTTRLRRDIYARLWEGRFHMIFASPCI